MDQGKISEILSKSKMDDMGYYLCSPQTIKDIINECAIAARNYTIKTCGLSDNFGGVTNVEIEIRKLYEDSN
jgi:hypothetical protein